MLKAQTDMNPTDIAGGSKIARNYLKDLPGYENNKSMCGLHSVMNKEVCLLKHKDSYCNHLKITR